MKIIHSDFKKGEAKLKIENLDDLWYLSTIIDPGDHVKGRTFRKIKLGEKEQRSTKAVKKPVFLKIMVDKTEFSKDSNVLRVLGNILEGPDDISRGSHHTFNLDVNSVISIEKHWLGFQIERLKEASSNKSANIVICVHDREEAYFAIMKKYGYEMLSNIKGEVAKKGIDEKVNKDFYAQIIGQIKDYAEKYKAASVIVASPAFWKDELMKSLKDEELKKKMIFATCSSVGKPGIDEVLKREETRKALEKDRTSKELNMVEMLLSEISKDGRAAYGLEDSENAVNSGAVENLLVCDSFIRKARAGGTYERIDQLMKNAEKMKARITIISSENEGGKRLEGLGGIGAVLRFKMSY